MRSVMARWRAALAGIAAMLAALAAPPAASAMRAVLVGVSEYPSLDKRYQLEGPRNDVLRLRAVLLQRGLREADIELLADGVEGAALPTREAILGAWRRAADKAAAGDVLLLYFAGHGSQQPADRRTPEGRDEVDGLHEIILPRDVGAWSDRTAAVDNAIVDHELRRIVDGALAKGAFVWAVFDACHSATLVRSVDEASAEVRYRQVAPSALGVPRAALDAAGGGAPAARPAGAAPSLPGGSAFFYAVQTDQAAPEMRLPLGAPARVSHGLFSFTIARALESGRPMTYRQLAQQVLADYGAMNEARVTPLFTGSALDRAVLDQPAPPLRQWAVVKEAGGFALRAGSLSDIAAGSVFALVPGPLAGAGEVIGHLRAESVEAARSVVVPVAFGGAPALDAAKIPAGAHARLLQRPVGYALRVGVDASACRGCAAGAALDRLRARAPGSLGVQLDWVAAGQTADVRLRLQDDAVQVLSPSQQLRTECARGAKGCAPAPLLGLRLAAGASPDAQADELAGVLHRIGRATNLLRLAAAQPAAPGAAAALEMRLALQRGGQRQAIGAERVPQLKAGDVLLVGLRNPGRTPVDVTVLYADAHYGISALWPDASGGDTRLGPGEAHELSVDVTDETVGIERVIAIGAEVQAKADRTDLSFLAQPPLAALRGGAEASGNADVQAFRDAGFAEYATRGGELRRPSPRTSMQVQAVQVLR